MSSELRLKVGNNESVVSLNGENGSFTDAQVAKVLERYAKNRGLSVEGTAQQRLTRVLEYIKEDIRRTSRAFHLAEEQEKAREQIQQVVDAENGV